MDANRPTSLSRRSLIKYAAHAAGGIAIVSLSSQAPAADKKLAKSAVQYQDAANKEGQDCDDCVHFIAGKTPKSRGTCQLVEGTIDPHGHCIAFKPK